MVCSASFYLYCAVNVVFLVENLAHRKHISLNDLVSSLSYASPSNFLSHLVDGYDVPSRCTAIDSTRCRNNEPHLILDLHRNYYIHGVIIQQLDTCKENLSNEKNLS